MKNQKGFTLVELLASFVILSIVMLVAVPSTVSMVDKSRRDVFVSDAERFIALAESEIRNDDKLDVSYGGVLIFKLSDFNDGTFNKDPDGSTYNQTNSYVVAYKNGNASSYQFDYYVQLIGAKRGITLTSQGNISVNSIKTNGSLPTVDNAVKSAIGRTPAQTVYAT